MKKKAALLCLAALLLGLCACAKETAVSPTLEFQGIPWNSSPQEVIEKLELKPEQVTQEEADWQTEIYLKDWEVFGETADTVRLAFTNHDPKGNYFGLDTVLIAYPEGCDKEKILSNLRKEYGQEAEAYAFHDMLGGEVTYTKTPGQARWVSQTLVADLLTEEEKEAYRDMVGDMSDKQFQGHLTMPVAMISWWEDFPSVLPPETAEEVITQSGHYAFLSITGSSVALLNQKFGALSE